MFVIIAPVRLNASETVARDSTQSSGLVLGRPAVLVLEGEQSFGEKKLPRLGREPVFMRQGVWG